MRLSVTLLFTVFGLGFVTTSIERVWGVCLRCLPVALLQGFHR